MLAPMQGLTNRALRSLFADRHPPDVLFTELVRVRPKSKKSVADSDRPEFAAAAGTVPLVVQLIGRDKPALLAAAATAQDLGARHININLGCPFGRMTGHSAGGALLKDPAGIPPLLAGLRATVAGSFSVKLRTGYDDPEQIFSLLPMLEDAGVDFLILHARTVVQRYEGAADHRITARVVAATRLPVIANGDIRNRADAVAVRELTGAAGLMIGRGAISDPWIFARIRGEQPAAPDPAQRQAELRVYLGELASRYRLLFCGERQVLCKLKAVLSHIDGDEMEGWLRKMKRADRLDEWYRHLGCEPR
ncbi:MAG: tRNA-dihydrouridine synthase family protein [Thermodesulfobacteriota bacterium]